MATWKVQQKMEVWKETFIEAETYEEAIDKAWDTKRDWEVLDGVHYLLDDFWLENQETGKCLTVSPDGVFDGN